MSSLYGREGGGRAPGRSREEGAEAREHAHEVLERRRLVRVAVHGLRRARGAQTRLLTSPSPPRASPPVLTGHVSSLTPY